MGVYEIEQLWVYYTTKAHVGGGKTMQTNTQYGVEELGARNAGVTLAFLGLFLWFFLCTAPVIFGGSSKLDFGWNVQGAFQIALPFTTAIIGYYVHKYPTRGLLFPVWFIAGHALGMAAFQPVQIQAGNYIIACVLTLFMLLLIFALAALSARIAIAFFSSLSKLD